VNVDLAKDKECIFAASMKGYMFVGDQVVSEATFTAQIVKNK
jgi:hypothetical protein